MEEYSKTNIIASYIIGYLATYLPFFIMTRQVEHLVGGLGLGFAVLQVLEFIDSITKTKK
jgi:dolichyl-phosphate-mannose--protein O-mannosyl transferase